MFTRTKLSLGLLAAFGTLSVFAPGVQAQTQQLDRVEITGSSIKRVAAEGALPVQTFTQADIQRSGVTSVTDFIQMLPVMQGFSVAADSVGGGGGGVTTASIHDVGEQYTLVLLNGRRVAPSNSGTTIDLNSIPLAAVERVEVLTDGASALYGADAIAGVVNFILKKGAAPFQIDVKASKPMHKGGESYNLGVSKGFGGAKEGYSLFASLSYDKSKQLKAKDRDFAKTGIIEFKDQNGRDLYFFNGSSRSVPPNVDVYYSASTTGRPVSFNPYLMANGNCPADHVVAGRQCIFDYTSTVEIYPEQERTSLFLSGDVKLGASGFKLFADVGLVDAHIISRIAPYPAEFALDKTHPYYTKYIEPYLTQQQKDTLTDINVKYRLYDMGNRGYDYNTKTKHVVAGVDGNAGGWDINSAVTLSKQRQLQDYISGFPLADKFDAALQAQQVDPFAYTVGQMPASMLSALNSTQFVGNYNTTDISMTGIDARASRELFTTGAGSAMLGLGVDGRQTGYKVKANPAVANAQILFDDPQPEFDLKQKSAGLFTELLVPLAKGLEVTGSVRYDSISGVTDEKTGKDYGSTQSATTYKVHGRYQPTGSMLFRGSYGTGFRTATMKEIAQPLVDFGVTGGTYQCPFNAGYDPLGYFAAGYVCDNLQKEVFQGGNADLKPEKSKQWSLGTVLEPMKNVTVGLDLWSVSVDNAVSSVSERLILQNPQKYLSLYTTKYKSSNNKTYVAIKDMPINIGKMENQGIDWDFQFKTLTEVGQVTGRLGGTYLIKSRYTTPGTNDQWETSVGRFGSNDAVSFRNVFAASLTLDTGAWTHTAKMNYRSGYDDIHFTADDCSVDDGTDCVDVQLRVPEYITFDWQTKWSPTKSLSLVLGVANIFNEAPPLSLRNTGSHQLGYDPRYASPLGRTYSLGLSYKF
jgi:iron complex outermembrane receptor protein